MNEPREDQPMVLPAFPTRPDDLPNAATFDELIDAYHQHLMAVVGSRGPVELADRLSAPHAIAALAIAQAIVDTFAGSGG